MVILYWTANIFFFLSLSPSLPSLPCTLPSSPLSSELHTCVDDNLERFYHLYSRLSSNRQDLAMRWTDFEQTLLYR